MAMHDTRTGTPGAAGSGSPRPGMAGVANDQRGAGAGVAIRSPHPHPPDGLQFSAQDTVPVAAVPIVVPASPARIFGSCDSSPICRARLPVARAAARNLDLQSIGPAAKLILPAASGRRAPDRALRASVINLRQTTSGRRSTSRNSAPVHCWAPARSPGRGVDRAFDADDLRSGGRSASTVRFSAAGGNDDGVLLSSVHVQLGGNALNRRRRRRQWSPSTPKVQPFSAARRPALS